MTDIQSQVHADVDRTALKLPVPPKEDSEAKTWEQIFSRLKEARFKGSAVRIKELLECDDFEEGEKPLSIESVQRLLTFILECKNLEESWFGEPLLGLFHDGMLSAEWRSPDQQHLAMKVFDSDHIFCSILGPDMKFTLQEKGSCKKILAALLNHGVQKWRK